MAIDAEDILVCVWRFLRFFVDTSYICAQKHPFLSCTLLLFLFLYVFFNLLVYHSPFLICIAILIRFFWTSEHPTSAIHVVKEEKEKEEEEEAKEKENIQRKPLKIPRPSLNRDAIAAGRKCASPSLRKQKSRRTRVKPNEKNINIERDDNVVLLDSKEENELLFPLSIDKRSWSIERGETSTSTQNNISRLDEEQKKVVDCEISKLGHDEHNLLPRDDAEIKLGKSDVNGVLKADKAEDAQDEEEEEAHEGVNNKAVEWTEDDQKNLADLGLSEIERNRRLESLIAKRKARKLIKNQLEKGLIHMESVVPPSSTTTGCLIPPIFVARSNPFEVPNVANDVEGLQAPGSAPSILLPTQNPFDLPYDPLEEKPNLMADSFTQEFTAVNQKETMFCRHESFFLGPSQFNADQGRRDTKFNTFFPSEKRELMEGLGSSGVRKMSGDHDRLMEQLWSCGKSHIDHTPSVIQSAPQCAPHVSNSGSSKIESVTETKNDMISEEEILNIMESANQMDSISTITEVDTEPSAIEDNETTSTSSFEVANRAEVPVGLNTTHKHVEEGNMFSCSLPTAMEAVFYSSPTANDNSRMDDDRMFFGDNLAAHTPSYSIASDMLVEVSEVSSPPLTVGNISPNDGESLSYDEETFDSTSPPDDTTRVTEEGLYASAPENPETTMQLADKLAAHPFFQVLSETKEKSLSPGESIERNTVYDVRDSVSDTIEDQEKHEEVDGAEQILSGQEIVENMAEQVEIVLKSNAHTHCLSTDSAQPIKGHADMNLKRDRETQIEKESVADVTKLIEAEYNSITIEERKHEQGLVESEVSCTIQKYEEAFASDEQQESVVEEVVIDVKSSSSSSPISATVDQIPVDEVSSLNLDQPSDVPKSDIEDEVKSSSQEEQQPNDTSLIMPQNVTLQEPSALEKFTDETSIIVNISEPLIEDKSGTKISETETDKGTREEAETPFNPEVAEDLSENILNVWERTAERPFDPPHEAVEQNAVYEARDSVSEIIDDNDIEDQEKHGHGGEQMLIRQEIVENVVKPAEETGSESAKLMKGDAKLNLKGDNETQTEQESIMEASKSIEIGDNLIIIERKDEKSLVESEVTCINKKYEQAIASADQQESIVLEEELVVNSSSSSSPMAATIEHILVDELPSSNLDRKVQMKSEMEDEVKTSSQEEQSPDDSNLIRPRNEEHLVEHSERFQKPSASDKFTGEVNISSNVRQVTNKEAVTSFDPEVAEELTGSRSKEDIKTDLGKLAQEPTKPPSKASEEGSYELNGSVAGDKEHK